MSQPDHLQPGFEPNKLKVAQLRGILLEYNVSKLLSVSAFLALARAGAGAGAVLGRRQQTSD